MERDLTSTFWSLIDQCGITRRKDGKGLRKFLYSEEHECSRADRTPPSAWSPDAPVLQKLLAGSSNKLKETVVKGANPQVPSTEAEIRDFFRVINLRKTGLQTLDAGVLDFHRLEELSLTGNKLQTLQYLPPNLRVLNVYANKIETINVSSVPPLLHLGIGYNELSSASSLAPFSRTLTSLDLSQNRLSDLGDLVNVLRSFGKLQHIRLKGNPLCLNKYYRYAVAHHLPSLSHIDGLPVPLLSSSTTSTNSASARAAQNPSPSLSDHPSLFDSGALPGSKNLNGDAMRAAASSRGPTAKKMGKKDKEKEMEEEKERERLRAEAERERAMREKRELEETSKTPEALREDSSISVLLAAVRGLFGLTEQTDDAKARDKKVAGKTNKSESPSSTAVLPVITTTVDEVRRLQITVKKQCEYSCQYRLVSTEWITTTAMPPAPVMEFYHLHHKSFTPDCQWRDLIDGPGLEVLLMEHEHTTTITSPLDQPAKEEVHAVEKDKKGKVVTKKTGSTKGLDVPISTSEQVKVTPIATAYIDISSFLSAAPSFSIHELAMEVPLVPYSNEPFDPMVERRPFPPTDSATSTSERPLATLSLRVALNKQLQVLARIASDASLY